MKRKIVSLLLAVMLAASMMPGMVFAEEILYIDNCGDQLVWTLDSDGVLTISGEGPMDDWGRDAETYDITVPWYEYRESILAVIIEDGVTHIGDSAFADCTSLTSVSIPDSVTSFGGLAFSNCSRLTTLSIPESMTSIGFSAFYNFTGLTTVTIPSTVRSIEDYAFYDCTSLSEVYYGGTEAQWKDIAFGQENNALISATIHFNNDNEQKDTFTVTLDPMRGTVSPDSITVTQGESYGTLPVPDRTGYRFDGWLDGDGAQVTADTIFDLNMDQTLYAQWTAEVPEGFVLGDVNEDGSITIRDQLLLSGYLEGNEDLSDRQLAASDVNQDGEVTERDLEILNQYLSGEIEDFPEGPEVVPVSGVMLDKRTVTLASRETTQLTASVFPDNATNRMVVWATGDSSVVSVDETGVVTGIAEGTATVTVTTADGGYSASCIVRVVAEGDSQTYTVTFNANGGTGSMEIITATVNEPISLPANGFTAPEGKQFKAWQIEENEYQPGEEYTLMGDTTVTAVWEQVVPDPVSATIAVGSVSGAPGGTAAVPVTIISNPGIASALFSISYDKSALTLDSIEKGEVFSKGTMNGDKSQGLVQWWDTDSDENITDTGALFTLNFTVKADAQEGKSYPVSVSLKDGESANLCNKDIAAVPVSFKEGSVEVKKASKEYTITYAANGGGGSMGKGTATESQPFTLPANGFTAPSGQQFKAWKIGSQEYQPGTEYTFTDDTTVTAVWEDIPPNEKTPDIASLSYSFSNSHAGLDYAPGYKIPLERFKMMFGDNTRAKSLWWDFGEWGGSCYGFSSTAGMFFVDGNGVNVSDFKAGDAVPGGLSLSDRNNGWNLTVRDFMEAMQVSQFDETIQKHYRTTNDLNGLCQAVSTFSETGNDPVLIAVFGAQGGHALLGYKLDKTSATTSRLYVYDCNYPNSTERYLTLTTDSSGNYTDWYYHLNDTYDWGSAYPGSSISYVPYSDFLSVWENRAEKTGVVKDILTVNEDVTIRDAEGNAIATIKDGTLTTGRKDIFPMVELGIPADGTASEKKHTSIYIPADLYQVERFGGPSLQDAESFEMTVTHVDQSASVTTNAGKVTVAVDDANQVNFVSIDEQGSTYDITLNSTLNNAQNKELHLTGTVMDKVVSLMQSNGVMGYGGITTSNAMTAGTELYVDGKLYTLQAAGDTAVPVVSFQTNGGDGNMSPQAAAADGSFTFPKCEFTAPNGRSFLGWTMNDKSYAVGDRVTLTENATVSAKWSGDGSQISVQSVKTEKNTASVTVAGAPDSGTMIVAAYRDGRMLASGAAELNGSSTYKVNLNTTGAKTISVFLLDGNHKPMCEKYSIGL